MKTKILILFLALIWLLPMATSAQFTYTTNNGAITITSYTGAGGKVIIPASTNGYPVTVIGAGAFYYCFSLTGISIPNSVTSIGDLAFASCTSLTGVTIPNGVTNIGFGAFNSCGLTNITIPNSVTNIGNSAFYYCSSLTGVTIPNRVTSIGDGAFAGCSSLTSITIPNSVTSIGNNAFDTCTSLTSVTMGNHVTSIGSYAFAFSGGSLTNFTFQGNAPGLGSSAFSGVAASAKVYYYQGTSGWGATYGGLPTVMLNAPATPPQIGSGGSLGVQSGKFGFTLIGVVNQIVVIEASTNLVNWQPIWTNTLSATSVNFTDPQWTNYPSRFYRVRSF